VGDVIQEQIVVVDASIGRAAQIETGKIGNIRGSGATIGTSGAVDLPPPSARIEIVPNFDFVLRRS